VAASVAGARVVAVDLDPRAARCARRNGVAAAVGDLAGPLRPRAWDLVTAVAPYVPTAGIAYLPADVQRWEPRRALDGGDDGLDLVRRVVAAAADGLLRPGGWLAVEVGGDQDSLLAPTLAAHGFAPATAWHDEDGDLRGVAARWAG
jgi:release factor glutamine methyltransferase